MAAMMGAALLAGGCGHRASTDVSHTGAGGAARKPFPAIIITEGDITNRKYVTIGDVTVFVSKNTIFDVDPTREMVRSRLQETAGELGADAVVFARYGAVGVSVFSWGSMEGKGRAVRFTD